MWRPEGWATIQHKKINRGVVDLIDEGLTDAFNAGADAMLKALTCDDGIVEGTSEFYHYTNEWILRTGHDWEKGTLVFIPDDLTV